MDRLADLRINSLSVQHTSTLESVHVNAEENLAEVQLNDEDSTRQRLLHVVAHIVRLADTGRARMSRHRAINTETET